ncbi:hypothetical protein DM992_34150 [Burkholderia sp. JP2-270]|nr:hypothetical protein DM992_34150 [Burkholderia sp. JP2-270]
MGNRPGAAAARAAHRRTRARPATSAFRSFRAPRIRGRAIDAKHAVWGHRTRFGCRTGNFVGAICGGRRFTILFVTHLSRTDQEGAAAHAGAQLIMLRRRPKTVESCRAGAPNRDNRHFGGA